MTLLFKIWGLGVQVSDWIEECGKYGPVSFVKDPLLP